MQEEIYIVHAMHIINEKIESTFVLSAHKTKEGAADYMRKMKEADLELNPNYKEWKYWSERLNLMD